MKRKIRKDVHVGLSTRKNPRSAAVLTVYNVPGMNWRGRRAIAEWLQRQAIAVQFDGNKLAKRYTARYLY